MVKNVFHMPLCDSSPVTSSNPDVCIIKPLPIVVLEKEKFDSTGEFQKVKAKGVVLGNQQELLAAYLKEAPTASVQSFYILILIAAKLGIPLISKDVTGAFLNATLDISETEV